MTEVERLIQRVKRTQHGFTDIRTAADELAQRPARERLPLAKALFAAEAPQARMLATFLFGDMAAHSRASLRFMSTHISRDADWRVQEILAQAFDRFCRDTGYETALPGAASNSFWLNGSAWQFPDFDNAETFIGRLVRDDVLVRDPVVNAALHDQPPEMSSRTLRHHFLRATGLTQGRIQQMKRAQQAALLQQGVSILDTVHETGYFDQPHLTRSLKQFIMKEKH